MGKCCTSVVVSAFDAHDPIYDLGIAGDPLDVLGDVWAVLLVVLYGFGQVGTRLRRIDHQGHVEWIVGYVDRSSGIPSTISWIRHRSSNGVGGFRYTGDSFRKIVVVRMSGTDGSTIGGSCINIIDFMTDKDLI